MPLFLAGMPIFGLQRSCQTTFISLNQPRVSLLVFLHHFRGTLWDAPEGSRTADGPDVR